MNNRQSVEKELLEMCDFRGDWTLVFDLFYGDFKVVESSMEWFSPYRFYTEQDAKTALDKLGTEKLKLLYVIE